MNKELDDVVLDFLFIKELLGSPMVIWLVILIVGLWVLGLVLK